MGREEHKRARLLLESKGSQLFRSIVSIVLLALRVFLFNGSICSDVPLLELFFDKGLLLSLESETNEKKIIKLLYKENLVTVLHNSLFFHGLIQIMSFV